MTKAFKREDLYQNSFNLYKNEGGFFSYSFFFYLPIAFYYFIFNPIMISEVLHNIPWIQKQIINEDHKIDRMKTVAFRCVVLGVLLAIAIMLKDPVEMLNYAGTIFSPFGSFFIPVASLDKIIAYYSYCKQEGIANSTVRIVHDTIYTCVAVGIMCIGVAEIFKDSTN